MEMISVWNLFFNEVKFKRISHQDLNYKEISSFLTKFVKVFPVILWMNKDYFPILD